MNIIQLLNSRDLIFLPHEDFACIFGHEVGFKRPSLGMFLFGIFIVWFILNYMISIVWVGQENEAICFYISDRQIALMLQKKLHEAFEVNKE